LRVPGPLHPTKKQRLKLHCRFEKTKQFRALRKIRLQNNEGRLTRVVWFPAGL